MPSDAAESGLFHQGLSKDLIRHFRATRLPLLDRRMRRNRVLISVLLIGLFLIMAIGRWFGV